MIISRNAILTALLIVPLGLVACSSDDTDGDGPEFERPQILPRLSPVCIEMDTVVGSPRTVPWDFTNRGAQTLVINSVEIVNDNRSAFTLQGFDPEQIVYDTSGIVQFVYDPPDAGWDSASLEVRSNAENFPFLRIFILGRAIPADLDAGSVYDAGPKPPEAITDAGEACAL